MRNCRPSHSKIGNVFMWTRNGNAWCWISCLSVKSHTSRDSGEKWKIAKHCQLGIQHVHQILPKFRSPISYNYLIWALHFLYWHITLECPTMFQRLLKGFGGQKCLYSASTLGTPIVQIGNLKTDLLYCWLQCVILIGQKKNDCQRYS